MRKNTVESERPQMSKWRIRNFCWILKATNTHSKYVILIAFPLQQWWHERVPMLRYMYTACLVGSKIETDNFHIRHMITTHSAPMFGV